MKWELIIVGRGGQGVLLLGRVIGLAASKYANMYAVITESYASETRGGESRSDVIVASSPEEAPYVKVLKPDIAIFMYPYRVEQYKSMLTPSTLLFLDEEYVDPQLFKGFRVVAAKYSEVAEKATGTRRVANMVILGKVIKETGFISLEHARRALEELVPGNWLPANLKALEVGYNL